MPLNAKLVVVGGDVKTSEIKLRLPSTIGRGRGTTIMLSHPLVSRQHCELYEADGQLMVRDLGSLNGTFVNNQRITEAPLPPGELLTIGTVTFRAIYESAGAAKHDSSSAQAKPIAQKETLKTRSGDSSAKAAAQPQAEPEQVELEFNFDEPLAPLVDEDSRKTEAVKSAPQRVDTAAEEASLKSTQKAPASPAPGGGKTSGPPAEEARPAAAGKDQAKPGQANVWSSDEDEEMDSTSDDDLNDFLKSLGK